MTQTQRERVERLGLNPDDFARKDTEKRIAELEGKLEALSRYQGLTVLKKGNGVFEVAKPAQAAGDYTDPIPWEPGAAVTAGLWYYAQDRELPHEAIRDGVPADFRDRACFTFVD